MFVEYNNRRDIVKSDDYDPAMAVRQYIFHGGHFNIQQWPTFGEEEEEEKKKKKGWSIYWSIYWE